MPAEVNTHSYFDATLHTPPWAHTRTHTHAKNIQNFGVGTVLVIAVWVILPVLCVSLYRLGDPAITNNPN